MVNTDFDRFTNFIRTVIDSIDDSFFHGGKRKIPYALGLCASGMLKHFLLDVVTPDEIQGIPGNAPQRPLKDFFFKTVATGPMREIHHVNLCGRKIFRWIGSKKQ